MLIESEDWPTSLMRIKYCWTSYKKQRVNTVSSNGLMSTTNNSNINIKSLKMVIDTAKIHISCILFVRKIQLWHILITSQPMVHTRHQELAKEAEEKLRIVEDPTCTSVTTAWTHQESRRRSDHLVHQDIRDWDLKAWRTEFIKNRWLMDNVLALKMDSMLTATYNNIPTNNKWKL